MRKRSDVELKREAIAKIIRTTVRLKHTLAYYKELNETLPDTLEEFDNMVLKGQLPKLKLTVSDLLKDL